MIILIMPRIKGIHVVPHSGMGWGVKKEGNQRSSFTYNTQRQAIEKAREIARKEHLELSIHDLNGQIREKDSYGNDPFPPKG